MVSTTAYRQGGGGGPRFESRPGTVGDSSLRYSDKENGYVLLYISALFVRSPTGKYIKTHKLIFKKNMTMKTAQQRLIFTKNQYSIV